MPPESETRQERKARPEPDTEQARAASEGRVERWTAAVAGATEGFAETSEQYDLPSYAGEAVHEGRAFVRAAVQELRVTTEGNVVLERRFEQAEDATRRTVEQLEQGARNLQETIGARKDAVFEAADRLRDAPQTLRQDARHATTEAKQAVKWSGIGIAGGAVLAFGGTLLLMAALAQAAMLWLGPVAGLWFATGAFLVLAAVVVVAGQGVAKRHVREVRQTMQHMRSVARAGVRPLRQAVSSDPPSHHRK